MEEMLLIVTRESEVSEVEVRGCVSRDMVHVLGIPHTSVQLIPVGWDTVANEPVVFMHKRSPFKRVCPSSWDFCGGHVAYSAAYFTGEPWCSPYRLDLAVQDTAVREANEELRCTPQHTFTTRDIHRFQQVGFFECETTTDLARNVEFSTCFVVAIPTGLTLSVWDEDRHGERQLEVRQFLWQELIRLFQAQPDAFADGAGRILAKADAQPQLGLDLEQLTYSVARLAGDKTI
jgi:8-oxo-dGTP pyrophosphatase MutT (NUDIX family)